MKFSKFSPLTLSVFISMFFLLTSPITMVMAAEDDVALQEKDDEAEEVTLPPFNVKGFRSAKFGMKKNEVIKAIDKDFGVKKDAITERSTSGQGTEILSFSLDSLMPGPGRASLIYTFGYTSKKLIQIRVLWNIDAKSYAEDPDKHVLDLINSSKRLTDYFSEYSWLGGVNSNTALPEQEQFALFFGVDENENAVQLTLSDVGISEKEELVLPSTETERKVVRAPYLALSYIWNIDSPDVYTIKKGYF